MTSNVGSKQIAGGGGTLGFSFPGTTPEDDQYQRLHTLVMDEFKVSCSPTLMIHHFTGRAAHKDSGSTTSIVC